MRTDPLWLEATETPNVSMQIRLVYVGNDFRDRMCEELPRAYNFICSDTHQDADDLLNKLTILNTPDLIVIEADVKGRHFKLIQRIRDNVYLSEAIVIILSKYNLSKWRKTMAALKVHDYYLYPFSINHIHQRIALLLKLRLLRPNQNAFTKNPVKALKYTMPFSKRLFDIVFAGMILTGLAPILLLIIVLIKLTSKGPAIYRSKRVGTGYRVFSFYKFRSMHTDADKKIGDFENFNQYLNSEDTTRKAVFFKILNDPRITSVGRFLRSTSLDELPQLYNILIGDMSFVGNRPLPLYEAEQLTSNEWSKRFLGPAGLTGLWQIKQRGKAEVSELERKKLDNNYVTNHSFYLDLKILIQTIPAIFQKARV